MLRTIGLTLTVLGLLAALAGALWNQALPTPDANIGAGLLVTIGLPVTVIGIVLLFIAFALSRTRRGREDER